MEDENGLELSLGLCCGGSAGKLKGKDGSSSDVKTEEAGNNSKSIGDLKNFLNTGIQKQDSTDLPQSTDPTPSVKQTPQENFFTNLAKSAPAADASGDIQKNSSLEFDRHGGGLWIANNKSAEVEEIKSNHSDVGGKMWNDTGNKRKILFEEINSSKKHEREAQHGDGHGKNPSVGASVRTSHVSVTTEDGSTAENEDVAESEVEGSTSRLVLHHEETTKRYLGGGGGSGSSSGTQENPEQKQPNAQPGNEPKHGNLTFGTTVPVMNLSSKLPNVTGERDASVFPMASLVQLRPPANNEGSGTPVNPGNMPLTFGYSPVQLPTLDTGRSWGLVSHPQRLPSPYASRSIGNVIPTAENSEDGLNLSQAIVQAPSHGSSEALPDGRKTSDLLRSGGKQHGGEEAGPSSSSQTEEEVKGNRFNLAVESFSHESAVIRPGIAAGVKFGGCGSYPDLPWVSTTGSGPNGRTISGVTYRYDNNQVRIVCACHGSHMSPEEFVQHASADPQSLENIGLTSFPSNNPAASAHS